MNSEAKYGSERKIGTQVDFDLKMINNLAIQFLLFLWLEKSLRPSNTFTSFRKVTLIQFRIFKIFQSRLDTTLDQLINLFFRAFLSLSLLFSSNLWFDLSSYFNPAQDQSFINNQRVKHCWNTQSTDCKKQKKCWPIHVCLFW